eukprot:COSAG06_NODE_1204_length_10277_cov_21.330517_9_plen_348_part_00
MPVLAPGQAEVQAPEAASPQSRRNTTRPPSPPPETAPLMMATRPSKRGPPAQNRVADDYKVEGNMGEALLKTKLNSTLSVAPQWLLSIGILAGIVVWLVIGNVAEGTIGEDDCPIDSWLVPLGGGVLAYIAAFGFFSVPAKKALASVAPLVVIGLFAVLFAWLGALLPYVIGCSSCSFMVILCVFNAGVEVEGPGGRAVVDYDFSHYRGYVSFMLVLGNGVMNAFGWLVERELGWTLFGQSPAWTRWLLATFVLPLLMLLPALLNILKGAPNGQYNVPGESTFIRLFISTRLGIYFCMVRLCRVPPLRLCLRLSSSLRCTDVACCLPHRAVLFRPLPYGEADHEGGV